MLAAGCYHLSLFWVTNRHPVYCWIASFVMAHVMVESEGRKLIESPGIGSSSYVCFDQKKSLLCPSVRKEKTVKVATRFPENTGLAKKNLFRKSAQFYCLYNIITAKWKDIILC